MGFDIEAQAAAVGAGGGGVADVGEHGFEDAVLSPGGLDIKALDPPEQAVFPVGPFVGNHQAGHRLSRGAGDDIKAILGIGHEPLDAGKDSRGVEGLVLGFEGHGNLKIGNGRGILRPGGGNLNG